MEGENQEEEKEREMHALTAEEEEASECEVVGARVKEKEEQDRLGHVRRGAGGSCPQPVIILPGAPRVDARTTKKLRM